MFNGVEYVRDICKQRKIPISTLEKECNFANGYLNPKKLNRLPYDRALKIAEYLNLDVNYLMSGENSSPSTLTARDTKEINNIMSQTEQLLKQEGLMFDGDPASPEAIDSILSAMQIGMEMAKKKNKEKYTPKKYKKD